MPTATVHAGPTSDTGALPRAIRLFLLLLLCGDGLYLALHAAHLTVPAFDGDHFSLETDRGLSEFYQYTKQLWLALCLAVAFLHRRHVVLLAWSAFFVFLMFDDALKLHEHTGDWLGQRLGLPAVGGLRPDDFGEMLAAGTVGAALLLGLAIAWWHDRDATWRASRELLLLTAALGVCGVVIDALHTIAFFRIPALSQPLAFLEDGGELVIVSVLTVYALDLAARGTAPPAGLRQLVRGSRSPASSHAA